MVGDLKKGVKKSEIVTCVTSDEKKISSAHNHLSNSYHSRTASKADTPVLNALQRKKMFSACPGRLEIGECFTLNLWAICWAYLAAWRLNSWSSRRSGVSCTLRWRLWYNSPCTSNGVISRRYKVFYDKRKSSESLRDIRKTLISATAIAVLIIRAKIYIEGKETCTVSKAFRNIDKKSLCRFSSWGRGGCRCRY